MKKNFSTIFAPLVIILGILVLLLGAVAIGQTGQRLSDEQITKKFKETFPEAKKVDALVSTIIDGVYEVVENGREDEGFFYAPASDAFIAGKIVGGHERESLSSAQKQRRIARLKMLPLEKAI